MTLINDDLMDIPQPLENIDVDNIKKACQLYIDALNIHGPFDDSDEEHYIFEAVIEAVYGKNIWKWINKKCK